MSLCDYFYVEKLCVYYVPYVVTNMIYCRPAMRENTRPHSARPVSDGYALGKSDWSSENLVRVVATWSMLVVSVRT